MKLNITLNMFFAYLHIALWEIISHDVCSHFHISYTSRFIFGLHVFRLLFCITSTCFVIFTFNLNHHSPALQFLTRWIFFTTDFIIIFPKLKYSHNHIMAMNIIRFTCTCTLFVTMFATFFNFRLMYLRSKTIIIASIVICMYVSNIKKWRLK